MLANQIFPILNASYNKNSVELFDKFVKFRSIYRVINSKIGSKVFFDTLKFVIKQQKKSSIF